MSRAASLPVRPALPFESPDPVEGLELDLRLLPEFLPELAPPLLLGWQEPVLAPDRLWERSRVRYSRGSEEVIEYRCPECDRSDYVTPGGRPHCGCQPA